MPTNGWIGMSMGLPPDGEVVMTRIDDGKGVRNEQALRRRGNLFFFPDESMYVYYAPTHWRDMSPAERDSESVQQKRSLDEKIKELQRKRDAM